jgi:NCAIR mutase (PurE)-related protein
MDEGTLRSLLEDVALGRLAAEEAARRLRRLPFADLGFARVDHHRMLRTGLPEAIYGPGKTAAQCAAVVAELAAEPGGPIVLTRARKDQVDAAMARVPGGTVTWLGNGTGEELAVVTWRALPTRPERVVVVTAGTADLPVARECEATLRALGFAPRLLADCGVAGVHRILGAVDDLDEADAVVVVAGMEGALASVVGGITGAPVVAVPTSAGYGAALEGVTALLAMLSSCAAGIAVVGIDNGFGAACTVARILHLATRFARNGATPTAPGPHREAG